LLSHLGCYIDLDVEPLTRGLVFVGVSEPQVWYPSRGVPDLVAGVPAAAAAAARPIQSLALFLRGIVLPPRGLLRRDRFSTGS